MNRMVQILSGALEGQAFSVKEGEELSLGRGLKNDVLLSHDPCLSTRHAVIRFVSDHLEINDQQSSNGTFFDGRKLKPGRFYRVTDFFVLGSTILTSLDTTEVVAHEPVALDVARKKWLQNPVFNKAVEIAQNAQHPYVSVLHLFIALLDSHLDDLHSFFQRTQLDPAAILERWEKKAIFDIPYRWLNSFINFQLTTPTGEPLKITPRVQMVLDASPSGSDVDAAGLLERLLSGDFNLLFPLLDWKRTESNWFQAEQEDVGHPTPLPIRFQKELILPDRVWNDLSETISRHPLVLLAGSKGCGKTALMHQVFHPLSGIKIKGVSKSQTQLFDTRVFVVFNPLSQLSQYVEVIIKATQSPGLVGIDHFDHLLTSLQEGQIDRGPLIQAIRHPQSKVVLALREEDTRMVQSLFPRLARVDLDRYVAEVRKDIHLRLLKNFEHKIQCLLSPEARQFFFDHIVKPAPNNIDAMEDFLALCVSKSYGIDFPFRELNEETRVVGMLGKTFFRDLYDEWVGRASATQEQRIVIQKASPDDRARDLVLQLETLVQTFVKNEFKFSLRYSDQTRSISEERFLSVDQKIEELKSQMVVLLTSYQVSFRRWFDAFWEKVGPEAIKAVPGVGNNAKKSWSEFLSRTSLVDTAYAEDHFHEIAARVFMEMWRSQKK